MQRLGSARTLLPMVVPSAAQKALLWKMRVDAVGKVVAMCLFCGCDGLLHLLIGNVVCDLQSQPDPYYFIKIILIIIIIIINWGSPLLDSDHL
jgi:hypothetical protein